MPVSNELRLEIVTPEKTLLDEPVQAIRFPLFDGQIGILPGRAPMIGRLGYGELKLTGIDGRESSFFVDGGFVQVKGSVVSILTGHSMSVDELDEQDAEQLLQDAVSRVPTTELDFANKERDLERSRRMLALARKPR